MSGICHLQRFAKAIKDVSLAELRGYHLQAFIDKMDSSPGNRRRTIIACQRPFRWAYKLGRIDRFPLGGVEKPPAGRREVVVSDAEFTAILQAVRDPEFADLLTVSWECGCRPQESVRVEARHVDLANSRWVFPAAEAKGRKRIRVVYLTDNALKITRKLMLKHPTGPLFRNERGRAWRAWSLNNCFTRIQIRMGMAEMKRLGIGIKAKDVRELVPQLRQEQRSSGRTVKKTAKALAQEARRKLRYRMAAVQ